MAYTKQTWVDANPSYPVSAARMSYIEQGIEDAHELGGATPPLGLIRFVDYQNGLDTNDGLSPSAAYKTIQACYDALVIYARANYTLVGSAMPGVGRIVLLPGNHDVGAGLNLDGKNPPEIIGLRSSLYYANSNSASTIVSSSSAADYLIRLMPATGTLGSGGRFVDLQFNVTSATNTALTKCLYTNGMNLVHVERCGFRNLSLVDIAATCIYQEGQGDCSYGRIRNCNSGHMQFYKAGVGTNNSNFNRNSIQECTVYNSGSLPSIQLTAEWFEGNVSFNDFSGTATAIELGGTDQTQTDHNVFVQNSGESPTSTNPFYKFVSHTNGISGPGNNIIVGGNCSCDTGVKGTWADFTGGGSGANILIGAWDYIGINGLKAKIVDNSVTYRNVILNGNSYAGQIPQIATKTAAYTLVAADSYVLADATASAFNCTLPTAVNLPGKVYTVKRISSGANNVTINTTSSQTIDGLTTRVLLAQHDAVTVISDGANWRIV